ncbi:uncharacterized protein CTRU02_211231 [Colletotrichum truncatum]|uniref:Uncharacterized protein n=2 Tax=Colletotrichum truncatum TaxID=5467 RepID=A0ACC3YRF3_COLTU|nr:uncharacterized protein CTRU02_08407 [Colletotrichum truncatum]XP_036588000.1 uncharacterized protein CTRU02_02012 [Colletotrichum truncatum]KAF6790278.1 hypothetical protein CTRU02_08407 [Colletotrichum truncatum]KAF6799141.1 hypothetical protein CTRU02_02012 [Colletotrichum truncatum]
MSSYLNTLWLNRKPTSTNCYFHHTQHLCVYFAAGLIAALAGQVIGLKILGHSFAAGLERPSPFGDRDWIKDNALSYQYPCGQDSNAAIRLGCVFELATGTWQPPECTHQQQEEKFRQIRNWKFFAYKNSTFDNMHVAINGIHDRNNLYEVALDQVQFLGSTVQIWTTWEFHLYRCAWLWRRDVLVANGNVTGHLGGRQHCVDEALMKEDRYALDDVVAGYRVRFLSCSAPPQFIV